MYSLKEFKKNFDPVLEEFLEKRISEFSKNTSDTFIKDFVSYSKTLTLAGGKRVRPYIAYVMYVTNGGKDIKNAIKLFISLEIFHMFALIHDDIMDKQNKRHGVETIHAYVLKKLREQKRTGDIQNVAKAYGILIGDLFFSWVTEILSYNKSFPQENISKINSIFYKMVDEVVLGQIIDIDITIRQNVSYKLISDKTRLKTSRYTFVRPMQIGAHLANPNNSLDEYCEILGTKLGIAFQIQDDLLDIIGDPDILEKNILRDVSDHQHTFFTNYVFENGSMEQKEKFLKYFGKELNENEQKEVIKIFIKSGAIAAGKKIITKNLNDAKETIQNSGLSKEYITTCLGLVKIMEDRQS